MTSDPLGAIVDPGEEVERLIRTLHETETRLRELTRGEVDAVMHPAGASYLLRSAQQQLVGSEAAHRRLAVLRAGILNALPANIALLDGDGAVIAANEGWLADDTLGLLEERDLGVGRNYLVLCDGATGAFAAEARQVAAGIRSILAGTERAFVFEFARRAGSAKRWLRAIVTPLDGEHRSGAVVMHVDISDQRRAEEEHRRNASRMAAIVRAQQAVAASAAPLEILLHELAEMAQQLMGADGASFESLDDDALVCRSASGAAIDLVALRFDVASTLSGEALAGNRPIRCDDAATDPHADAKAAAALGLASLVVIPLRGGPPSIGVLKVLAREAGRFDDVDVDSLELFAETLSAVIRRKRAGAELRARADQQAAAAELGLEALREVPLAGLMDKAALLVARTFDIEFCKILEQSPDGRQLRLVAGVGWKKGLVGHAVVGVGRTSQAGYALLSGGPVIVEDLPTDDRFEAALLLRDHGVRSGVSVPVYGPAGGYWGVIAAHSSRTRVFTLDDVNFMQIVANIVAAAIEREHTGARISEQASLLDKAHDAIIVRDLDHRFVYWNRGAETMYGWTADEALGRTADELLHPDPGPYRAAMRAVMTSGEWAGEIALRHRDGRAIVVEAHWTLIRDGAGQPKSILTISTDITARLAVEEQLRQSQRLEAVGQLTGGVAHDFNNLLTVIIGNAELLAEQLVDRPPLQRLVEMSRAAAERGAELTNRLLAFARRQPLEPKATDVNALLAGMEDLLQRAVGVGIQVVAVRRASSATALVDPAQLEGAVLNLCLNSRDAMERGGTITLETADMVLEQAEGEVVPGRYVSIAVTDTGTGIPAENLGRVFDPFFTTKDIGKGTGLGLSIIYGFVRQSRGAVRIRSAVGEGTTVEMLLPVTAQRPHEDDRGTGDAGQPPGCETVLVVEDHPLVRAHVEGQLTELGYQVIAVGDAAAALDAIGRNPAIDLLFTDIVLSGGMNGRQLADAARALRPGLRIVFTSGYVDQAADAQDQDRGIPMLRKPYRYGELPRTIRAILEAP